ncbi:transcriptional regulator [Novosphingobium kaempferiae]|uniref:transcriptional regulator n=1 Tax=Novosphingobium kaempferiae TaxID=2896849 RepID=UPI001E2B1470|nr:transcriptional regulator [Novosphingobium kaempferiae]
MTLHATQASDGDILNAIKLISGKLIERRRRRDHISQRELAMKIGRSDRWVREIEGGLPASALDDHIRCARALQMTTIHLFLPLIAVEHEMDVPRELLMQDDLWDLQCELLEAVARHQESAAVRHSTRSARDAMRRR